MKTQLLCTFIKKENFHHSVEIIISCNEILFNKLYVLQNENEDNQLMCTYNVEYNEDFMQGIPDTISLHRKKHTNTLYTINALNDLIRELNGGKLDKSFSRSSTSNGSSPLKLISSSILESISCKS